MSLICSAHFIAPSRPLFNPLAPVNPCATAPAARARLLSKRTGIAAARWGPRPAASFVVVEGRVASGPRAVSAACVGASQGTLSEFITPESAGRVQSARGVSGGGGAASIENGRWQSTRHLR